jgi:hypothetical protein
VLAACLLGVGALEADPLETRRASAQAYCDENAWDLPNCEQPVSAAVSDGPTVVSVDWSEFAMYLDAGYTLIVLSNYGRPSATMVRQVVHQMLAVR